MRQSVTSGSGSTPFFTAATTSSVFPTMGPNDDTFYHLIGIIFGTLTALLLLALIAGVAIALALVWACKTRRRRRIERDLVLRTKHDIFEGVPNYVASESGEEDPFHNVLDASSPIPDGGGSGTFELAAGPTESTLVGVTTDVQDCSIKTEEVAEK